jgi:hypothetical protein
MSFSEALLSFPRQIEQWLVLVYLAAVLVGAWVLEARQQVHDERAERLDGDRVQQGSQAHVPQLYRSLGSWAETDFGRFHARVALVMFAAVCVLAAVALSRWGGQNGTGLFVLALLLSGCRLIMGTVKAWRTRSITDEFD